MRSYAVISNVSIDDNRFLNLDVKNNIDPVSYTHLDVYKRQVIVGRRKN